MTEGTPSTLTRSFADRLDSFDEFPDDAFYPCASTIQRLAEMWGL